jgi:hypothetical protein
VDILCRKDRGRKDVLLDHDMQRSNQEKGIQEIIPSVPHLHDIIIRFIFLSINRYPAKMRGSNTNFQEPFTFVTISRTLNTTLACFLDQSESQRTRRI